MKRAIRNWHLFNSSAILDESITVPSGTIGIIPRARNTGVVVVDFSDHPAVAVEDKHIEVIE
jgi:hypothetical protein